MSDSNHTENGLMTNRGVAGDAAGEMIANSDGGDDHECTCGGHVANDAPDDAVLTRDEFERQTALAEEAVQNGDLDALTYLHPAIAETAREALDEVAANTETDVEPDHDEFDGGNPGVYTNRDPGTFVPTGGVWSDEGERYEEGELEPDDDEDPETNGTGAHFGAMTGARASPGSTPAVSSDLLSNVDVDDEDVPVGGVWDDED